MTFWSKSQDTAGNFLAYEEELRCPLHLPALDAPSSSVCLGVQRQDRLPCTTQPVSQEECEGKSCCYTPNDPYAACYYGNTVTAQCTPDGQLSIAVPRDVTLPSLILDSVHLVNGHGSDCSPVTKNDVFILYKFPLSACGTTLQVSEGRVYMQMSWLHIKMFKTGTLAVTRDSTFRLYIGCSYSTEDHLSLTIQVFTLPRPPLVTQYGPLDLELRISHVRRTPANQALQDAPRSLLMAEEAVDFQIIEAQTEQKDSCCTGPPILSREWERALVVPMGVSLLLWLL